MFSPVLIARAQEEGVLSLIQRRSKLSNNELPLEVVVEDILRNRIPDEYLYLANKVADHSKTPFSEWVIEQGDDEFDVFETLFNEIRQSLN